MRHLNLSNKNLTTLKGQDIPEVVNASFNCTHNQLSNLEFGPKEVKERYFCFSNKITSLEFCATKIGVELYGNNNLITNLKGIHKQFKNGYIGDHLTLQDNPLKSYVLSAVLIPELKMVFIDNIPVQDILNKHLKTRDVLDCQEELIQNGYKEFAQL